MVKKQLSDEQLDTLMRTLLNDAAADDTTVNEIADSPATWWGVQRKINEQKAVTVSPWPPVGKVLRWIMVGVPVTAAALLILSLFVFRPAPNNDNGTVAVMPSVSTTTIEKPSDPVNVTSGPLTLGTKTAKDPDPTKPKVRQIAVKPHAAEKRTEVTKIETAKKTVKKEEIKTEFIALSYARDSESGQIVRVRVPSSMMVSLGLVTSVKAPSELVDAEVIVGDDGLTRAIRFIR